MARAGGIEMSEPAANLVEDDGGAVTDRPPSAAQPRRLARRIARGLVVLVVAVSLVAVGVGLERSGILPGSPADPATASPQFRLIEQAWDLIHAQYVARASLDDTSLAYAAIGAVADALGDTGHTSFETPAELAAEQAVLSGQYVGIGVALEPSSGGAVVSRVFPGSPASRSGLKAGDLIVAVNGRDVTALTPTDLIGLIEGPAGSVVTLTVRPTAGGQARDVAITRAPVTIPVVEWAMVPGSRIADIRIEQFSDGATKTLVTVLKAAEAAGATRIVLDLRGNPGGLVSEAVGVASQFLGSGDVYQTRDASGHVASVPVQPGGAALKTAMVVLVDHGTASAAEIVAGAIQDANRAPIMGETTFGTGTILGQFTLADGSALRIGTVEWLTRNGHSTWHVGLKPDRVVALATGEQPLTPADLGSKAVPLTAIPDTQLRAAVGELER
jgi:carboxyl-terminal processing protease